MLTKQLIFDLLDEMSGEDVQEEQYKSESRLVALWDMLKRTKSGVGAFKMELEYLDELETYRLIMKALGYTNEGIKQRLDKVLR